MSTADSDLRGRIVLSLIEDEYGGPAIPNNEAIFFRKADAILSALGLDDLDACADRVLDGLPLGEPAFPALRRARMRQALENALKPTPTEEVHQ